MYVSRRKKQHMRAQAGCDKRLIKRDVQFQNPREKKTIEALSFSTLIIHIICSDRKVIFFYNF
jgi:hypothetical protein